MRIDLTLHGPAGEQDVRVDAVAPVRLEAVLPELRELVGGAGVPDVEPARVLRCGDVVRFGRARAAAPGGRGLCEVRVVGGPHAGRTLPVGRGGVTVGRSSECELPLADDALSRRHAVLTVTPRGVRVVDLGSTNGTFVDGVAVPRGGMPVRDEQVIRAGDTLLTVSSGERDGTLLEPDAQVLERPATRGALRPSRVQWVAALVPALAGVGLAVALGSPQFLVFALLSPLTLLSGALGDRLHWRRDRRRAAVDARRRGCEFDAVVAAAMEHERRWRRRAAPDPVALAHRARTAPPRRRGADDFLTVRVGTADLPSTLQVRDGDSTAPAGVLADVPVCVGLATEAVTVPAAGTLRWVVAQVAALHDADDVELVLLLDADAAPQWRWARWLPHLRRTPACTDAEHAATLSWVEQLVSQRRGPQPWRGRWTVVAADLGDSPSESVTARWHALRPDAARCGVALAMAADPGVTGLADQVSSSWCDALARALAARGGEASATATALADLVPGLDPAGGTAAIEAAWTRHDGCARTALGTSRDGPVRIDLVADGPHALVAGTTGSGKSELLRTLVVGLAAAYPPDALTVLLVDYKGGAAFTELARLPHTVGVVTDLDGAETLRALRSLGAELRRRERVFAAAGVTDLDGYRALAGGDPLPRLVIVVDEFAELATELPDFLSGLVGIARRGRSLGVHLVLATQRPGAAVSAEIRANTTLRVALRTAEPAESTDVVGVPDAAYLDPAEPGHAVLRRGGTTTAFRVARAGMAGRPRVPQVAPLGAWRRADPSTAAAPDLGAVVELLRAAGGSNDVGVDAPWRPALPAVLTRDELGAAAGTIAIGRLDLPDEQAQEPLLVDPRRERSVLVVGGTGTGRTSALRTVLAAADASTASPPDVHVIDGSGALVDAVGTDGLGTVVTPTTAELVPLLLERLATQHRPRAAGDIATVLLIDDWDRLLGDRDDAAAACWNDLLARVLRAAPTVGALVAVSGGRPLLQPRFAGGFDLRLLLGLSDRGDYAAAGVPLRELPHRFPPGRGLRAGDGAVFQLARPDPPVRRALRDGRSAPLRLRALPHSVSLAAVRDAAAPGLVLGVAGDLGRVCALDLAGQRARLVVAGPRRSGRSTALRTMLSEGVRAGHTVVVLAPSRSPLDGCGGHAVRRLDPHRPDPGPPPDGPALLLVDDSDAFVDTELEAALIAWLERDDLPLAAVVAGSSDDLLAGYRGLASRVRRERCGLLLRPGPLDGEVLGVRVPARERHGPPGRGLLVGPARWGSLFEAGDVVPIQVADPGPAR